MDNKGGVNMLRKAEEKWQDRIFAPDLLLWSRSLAHILSSQLCRTQKMAIWVGLTKTEPKMQPQQDFRIQSSPEGTRLDLGNKRFVATLQRCYFEGNIWLKGILCCWSLSNRGCGFWWDVCSCFCTAAAPGVTWREIVLGSLPCASGSSCGARACDVLKMKIWQRNMTLEKSSFDLFSLLSKSVIKTVNT